MTTKIVRLIALCALLVGCGDDWLAIEGADLTPKPNQERAVSLVWHDAYGMSTDFPSEIRWTNELFEDDGAVIGGHYDGRGIILMWEGSFSSSLLSHEMCHARQRVATGDADGSHNSPCFGGVGDYEGAPGSLLERAQTLLRANGL
jgi:hypothetical protein